VRESGQALHRLHPTDRNTNVSTPLRIIFAGTPEFAAETLAALLETRHELVAVYCQPDRPAGRGRELKAGPVKALAQSRQLPVFQPLSLKTPEAQAELAALRPDLMIVAAYGLLLPQAVLDIPRLGCINVHGSLLPRWRGAAPIQRAILAGHAETGITIMQMDRGLDTGAMLHRVSCPIGSDDTAALLHDRLARLGGEAMLAVLAAISSGRPPRPEPQADAEATYAAKLSKEDALINWQQPAAQLARQVRAFNAWPVAHTLLGGQNLRIWQARVLPETSTARPGTIVRADRDGLAVATGQGQLLLESLQLPGGKALSVAELLNAKRDLFAVGTLLQ
jgi:methionyl-tRNA formyltransferase